MSEQMEYPDDLELDLARLFRAVAGKWLTVLTAAALCAAVVLGVMLFLKVPRYESGVTFYVYDTTADGAFTGDIGTARKQVDSYLVILNTRQTLNEIISAAGVDCTARELEKRIRAEAVGETEFFRVTVEGENPVQAEQIADAIADILPGRISAIMEGTAVKVADAAVLPSEADEAGYLKSVLSGFLLGGLMAAVIIALRELLDGRVRREEDLEGLAKIPVLASVPEMSTDPQHPPVGGNGMTAAGAEAFRLLRTKLKYSFAGERTCRVVGITGAVANEGKTLTAVNLCWSLAQMQERVLLIECDLRQPGLREKLPVLQEPGLSGYLSGQRELGTILQPCGLPGQEDLFQVIAAGMLPPNPVELLSADRMDTLLAQLRQNYDWIILDLPPAGAVSDVLAVADRTDGMLLVTRREVCSRKALKTTIAQIGFVGVRMLGIVYNGACSRKNRTDYGK